MLLDPASQSTNGSTNQPTAPHGPASRRPERSPDARSAEARIVQTLRLGMPHLTAHGLCENWLLRSCAHSHWHMIAGLAAGPADRLPTSLRDRSGERVFASFVSVVVTGNLGAFREDDVVDLVLLTEPSAASGWRSVHEIVLDRRPERSCRLRIELVSVFARRGGPGNADLVAAEMTAPFGPGSGSADRAVARLKARARTMRSAARGLAARTPCASAQVIEACDFNGVGLLYFANYLRFVALAERTRLDGPWACPPVCRREIHYYGNADDGETLDLHCDAYAASVHPDPCIESFSAIARRSDGALIAACETRRA